MAGTQSGCSTRCERWVLPDATNEPNLPLFNAVLLGYPFAYSVTESNVNVVSRYLSAGSLSTFQCALLLWCCDALPLDEMAPKDPKHNRSRCLSCLLATCRLQARVAEPTFWKRLSSTDQAQMCDQNKHCLFGFTVPESVLVPEQSGDSVQGLFDDWWSRHCPRCSNVAPLSDVSWTIRTVTQQAVIL